MTDQDPFIPDPAIVQGDPVHHIAQILFDTDRDPHGLYADVRIQPPLQDATQKYLSEKGAGDILRPLVFTRQATLIEGFAKRYPKENTADRRATILSAVAFLVCDLDSISQGTGKWELFGRPGHDIEIISSRVADTD